MNAFMTFNLLFMESTQKFVIFMIQKIACHDINNKKMFTTEQLIKSCVGNFIENHKYSVNKSSLLNGILF